MNLLIDSFTEAWKWDEKGKKKYSKHHTNISCRPVPYIKEFINILFCCSKIQDRISKLIPFHFVISKITSFAHALYTSFYFSFYLILYLIPSNFSSIQLHQNYSLLSRNLSCSSVQMGTCTHIKRNIVDFTLPNPHPDKLNKQNHLSLGPAAGYHQQEPDIFLSWQLQTVMHVERKMFVPLSNKNHTIEPKNGLGWKETQRS